MLKYNIVNKSTDLESWTFRLVLSASAIPLLRVPHDTVSHGKFKFLLSFTSRRCQILGFAAWNRKDVNKLGSSKDLEERGRCLI
jgi:hypothetical protein